MTKGSPLDDSGRPIGYVFYFEFDRTGLDPGPARCLRSTLTI